VSKQADRLTDTQTDGQIDAQTDAQMDRQTDGTFGGWQPDRQTVYCTAIPVLNMGNRTDNRQAIRTSLAGADEQPERN
jgi:hypothetical protein